MDLIEDEPRQHPKPVPFCQNAPLQPTVPEVSLLLQGNLDNQLEKRSDSFSGIEFQTYNSWRWKHMNSNNAKVVTPDHKKAKPCSTQDCFLIKDKYSTSDIEKRKNEILYGELDEPRRPLPPRIMPAMPSCVESFFSNSSLDDLKPSSNVQDTLSSLKAVSPVHHQDKSNLLSYGSQACCKKEIDNSEKLYSIISEQQRQLQVLQNQIEQVLKLQGVKDKQIEQLLNSQESKEKKIEQLLQSLDLKDKEVELLTKSKDKQEQHLQELLKAQENLRKENANLNKRINEIRPKDTNSVGIMACVKVADAYTCTSFDGIIKECSSRNPELLAEGEITSLRDNSGLDEKDRSLSLQSLDLPVIQEISPTPQSSIHVDVQDFPDSSDESETEPGIPTSSYSKETLSNPLGYTFYNNVLTQLKDIIQNSGEKEGERNSGGKLENVEKQAKPLTECNFVTENRGSVQAFQAWNVTEKENVPCGNQQDRNERFTDKFQNLCIKDTSSPSDISLKINALALKYLKQEQISDFGLQTQIPASCQGDVTIYNVTNLSFGTMRYLDRYQMLPKIKESQKQATNIPKNEVSPAEFLRRKKRIAVEGNITSSIGNVLDITTLNQQPKLL